MLHASSTDPVCSLHNSKDGVNIHTHTQTHTHTHTNTQSKHTYTANNAACQFHRSSMFAAQLKGRSKHTHTHTANGAACQFHTWLQVDWATHFASYPLCGSLKDRLNKHHRGRWNPNLPIAPRCLMVFGAWRTCSKNFVESKCTNSTKVPDALWRLMNLQQKLCGIQMYQ